MKKKNISFITTASGKIGLGHLVRSISLAQMLRNDFNISFIVSTSDNSVIDIVATAGFQVTQLLFPKSINNYNDLCPLIHKTDIVVLDFYTITEDLQLAIKKGNCKLVCIDDLHDMHFYADVVINVSNAVKLTSYSCENYTQLLLGTNYTLLRPDFLESAKVPARKLNKITAVFISMGGADEPNNTLKFLKELVNIPQVKQIHVLIGPVNPHMPVITNFINEVKAGTLINLHINIDSDAMNEILLKCHLAICPASGISMELCAVGVGMMTGYTADNQKDLLKGLIDNKCAVDLKNINELTGSDFTNLIQNLIAQPSIINEMIINQKEMIDGNSAMRINEVFKLL